MEPNEEEVTEVRVELVSQESLALLTKAEIDAQVSTAKAFPRSLGAFIQRATSMATLNEQVAASCAYAVPRAGKMIVGPTVRLAEIICASFGNIRAGARIIANDGKTITAQGICHDIETNNCITFEVKKRITYKDGRTYSDDMQVTTGNAACAVAFRNAVFKVVPRSLFQSVIEAAEKVAKGTLATLSTRRAAAIEFFKSKGATEAQIFSVLEVKKVEDIDLDKLFVLTGMKSAMINEGKSVKDLFSPSAETITKEMLSEMLESKKGKIKEADFNRIKEIIEKNEVASFTKAHELLK